jgi:hypothetical protein
MKEMKTGIVYELDNKLTSQITCFGEELKSRFLKQEA